MLAAGLGSVGALLVAEVILRMAGMTYPLFYQPDPVCGFRLRPGAKGLYTDEGKAIIRINKSGWRDRDHLPQKTAGTYRIAVLGDSTTEALQVNEEDTFCSTLERELNARSRSDEKRFEVLNFGVSGYGTAQEMLVLQHHVWNYSPDAVLLAFTTSNDFCDNLPALAGTANRPFLVRNGNDWVLDRSFLNSAEYRFRQSSLATCVYGLIDYSRVIQLLNRVRYLARAIHQPTDGVYGEPTTKDWKEAWAVTEELIKRMKAEVTERGSRFYLVVLTNGIQVHPDEETRRKYRERHGLHDLAYPNHRLKQFTGRNGIEMLDLLPRFSEHALRQKVFLHGFGRDVGEGHWNGHGHLLAGRLIADWLAPHLFP